jgi:hypothetical protein
MYFYVLLYYCHRANTQLQLNKYIYIYISTANMVQYHAVVETYRPPNSLQNYSHV